MPVDLCEHVGGDGPWAPDAPDAGVGGCRHGRLRIARAVGYCV